MEKLCLVGLICRAMLYYAYCAIISQLYVILCLRSYGAHCGLLCLLCHTKPTVCHTMPTRVPCYAYNVILSCSTYCGALCLLILYLFFHNKPRVCHNLPTNVSFLTVAKSTTVLKNCLVFYRSLCSSCLKKKKISK